MLGRLTAFFSGVLWPLAVAGILALILRPAVDLLERRLHLRRLAAVGLLFGVFLLAVVGLLVLVVPPLVAQVLDFVAFLPTYWANAKQYVHLHYPDWIDFAQRQLANPTVRQVVDSLTAEGREWLAQTIPSLKTAGGGVLAVFGFATHLAIIPIYLFFLLLSRGEPTKKLAEHLPFLSPENRADVVFLVREFIAIVVSFFRGQLLIGLIMGVLLAFGFTLVGLKFALFLGLAIGVLNIVPYLGTIIGLAVTLPLAFFQPGGGWQLVGLVLLVKIVVQNIEGWFLTPQIMSHRTGLHPVAIIVAIFFWSTALDGLLGLVLAIPLTAFIVTAWRLARRKYFAADKPK
jgi:predicted PurR-regulated permease PerM